MKLLKPLASRLLQALGLVLAVVVLNFALVHAAPGDPVETIAGMSGGMSEEMKAELRQSSGFDRLDQVALATVQKWRYVPGKLGGVPTAMWDTVPINFVLE